LAVNVVEDLTLAFQTDIKVLTHMYLLSCLIASANTTMPDKLQPHDASDQAL